MFVGYPGNAMFVGGLLAMAWLLLGRLVIGGVGFDIHTLPLCHR
jgi:hypothetical protein